jgi:EpsI family protein
MVRRLVILSVCFILTAGFAVRAMRPELVPLRQSLKNIPSRIERWSARDLPPLTNDILAVLGVDEYIDRIYFAPKEPYVSLYIGYYQSQREGDTIHSPMNCLPGSGWEPLSTGTAQIAIPGRAAPLTINRYVIQKGLEKQVVLYWYQSHGRVIASEYASKFFMVYDAIRMNRSDAALVRVTSPIHPSENGDAAAERRATEFVQTLFPQLDTYLPS